MTRRCVEDGSRTRRREEKRRVNVGEICQQNWLMETFKPAVAERLVIMMTLIDKSGAEDDGGRKGGAGKGRWL